MKKICALLLLAVVAVPVLAHEYWLEPDSFFVKPGEKTAVRLLLGMALKKEEERGFQTKSTATFQQVSTGGSVDLLKTAADEAKPAFTFSAAKPGTYAVSMARNWSYITLTPEQFDEYLREDGMEYIIPEREKLGESKKPGRERYARFIKTLIQVGDKPDDGYKKETGMKVEIVPLDNPYSKKIGDELRFKVLFEGKPLADKTVFVDNRDGESVATKKLTTDKDGTASFKLDRKGVWLVRMVFMRRCAADCGEIDWESFWGALSFGMK